MFLLLKRNNNFGDNNVKKNPPPLPPPQKKNGRVCENNHTKLHFSTLGKKTNLMLINTQKLMSRNFEPMK